MILYSNIFPNSNISMNIIKIIAFILAVLLSLVGGIEVYLMTDRVPATFDDYLPLKNQLLEVQENPNVLLSSNCTITINNGYITYTIENDECKMTGKYDEQYNLIETRQKDKSISIFSAICTTLIFSVLLFIMLYVLAITIILLFELIFISVKIIIKLFHKKHA